MQAETSVVRIGSSPMTPAQLLMRLWSRAVSYTHLRGYLKNLFALPFMQHSAAAIKRELEEMSVPVSCLFDLVEEYALELRRICEEKNKYTFDIVSEKALRLLVASFDHETGIFETTELARAVAANFDGVMIDEYQDTSPLQDVCFAAVGRDDMFVVGDLKQSIYSFRGAKPEGFAKKRDVFRRLDLNKNFRSRKGVLDFANFVFSMIFSEEVGGVEYDDGERLNHCLLYTSPHRFLRLPRCGGYGDKNFHSESGGGKKSFR